MPAPFDMIAARFPAAMTENRTTSFLQSTSHVLIVGAAAVYLFGFIVVSIFDASYGIADFNLFRTKVISVGTLFVLLLAIPMLTTFRMFALFGLTVQDPVTSGLTVTPKNRPLVIVFAASSVPFACIGLTFVLAFLFATFHWWRDGFLLFMLPGAVMAALGVLGKKWFNAHPFPFVFLSFLNAAALFLILFKYTDRSIFWFVVWLSLVCWFTLQIFPKDTESRTGTQNGVGEALPHDCSCCFLSLRNQGLP